MALGAEYEDLIKSTATKHGVDPNLIRAIIRTESSFDPSAVSSTGAKGLMQLMPETAKRYGVTDITDPQQNIEGGAQYLKFLHNKFKGDLDLTIAAYNAGEGAVERAGGIPNKEYVQRVRQHLGELTGYQYVKLPDGSFLSFPSDASDEAIMKSVRDITGRGASGSWQEPSWFQQAAKEAVPSLEEIRAMTEGPAPHLQGPSITGDYANIANYIANLATGAWEGAKHEAAAASKAYNLDHPVYGGLHAIAAAVPFLGPVGGRMLTGFQEGGITDPRLVVNAALFAAPEVLAFAKARIAAAPMKYVSRAKNVESMVEELTTGKYPTTQELGKAIEESFKKKPAKAPFINELGLKEPGITVETAGAQPAKFIEGRPHIPSTQAPAEGALNIEEATKRLQANLNRTKFKPTSLPPSVEEVEFGQTAKPDIFKPAIPNTLIEGEGIGLDEATQHLEANLKKAKEPPVIQAQINKDLAKIVDKAIQKNPDTAYNLLFHNGMSADLLKELKRQLPPEVYRGMTAQALQDFLTQYMNAKGELKPGMATALNKGRGAKLQNILEPAQYAKLKDLARYVADPPTFNKAMAKLSSYTLKGTAGMAGIELFMHIGNMSLKDAAIASSIGLTARALSRAEGATLIQGFLRATAQNDGRRMLFYGTRLREYSDRIAAPTTPQPQPQPQKPKRPTNMPLLPPPG